VEVLRTDPDAETVRALEQLATLEVFAGSPEADRLTAEALTLGQALDVGTEQIVGLLVSRGIYLQVAERGYESTAYLRESARIATQIGDNVSLGLALLNLSDVLSATDPAAAADAARTAAGQLRRTGRRYYLTGAVMNLFQALLMLGDWDGAEAELARAADSDGLADLDYLVCARGLLAALRGDAEGAGTMLAALGDLRATEDPQDAAMISITEAFAAVARRQLPDALRHARRALSYGDALGIKSDSPRWAWPLAVRAAHELGDTDAVRELLARLDSYQPGHLAPMLRAERDLARVRLAARDEDGDGDSDRDGAQVVAASFAAAIVSLREHSTPYHLAHGLLDHARYLLARFDAEAAAVALEEARAIGHRLRCSALLDRAEDLARAQL
jgi:hypothetical protein